MFGPTPKEGERTSEQANVLHPRSGLAQEGLLPLVGVSDAEGAYLVPIRKILRRNEIEYHNVNAAGRSIYVRQEDAERAHLLTCHLQTAWFQKKEDCPSARGRAATAAEPATCATGTGTPGNKENR
jgi:hypothetical protein